MTRNLFFIKERTLDPINNNKLVRHSCTSSLLLMFSCIGFLSKIICMEESYTRSYKARFFEFMDLMGGNYALRKEELYQLREDLIDTGINYNSIMYHTPIDSYYNLHLELISKEDERWLKDVPFRGKEGPKLWIDTTEFLYDLDVMFRYIVDQVDSKEGTIYNNYKRRVEGLTHETKIKKEGVSPL